MVVGGGGGVGERVLYSLCIFGQGLFFVIRGGGVGQVSLYLG